MTDQSVSHDLQSQPPKKWRWWHFALAVVGLIVVLSAIGGGSPNLRVTIGRGGAGLQEMRILNADTNPISITKVVINDGKECAPRTVLTLTTPDVPFQPEN